MKQAFGLSIPEGLQEICTPERCAVVIYDMQVGIVRQIAGGSDIVMRCREILDAAREGGFRTFFMRHLFLPNRVAGVGQLRRAMIWQGKSEPAETKPFLTQGSAGWEIVPELQPRADEVVIDKITMSAFEGTFLNLAMRDAGLEAMMIAGIALEIGIEPTVRQALDLNYVPVLVTDACGSKTAELKARSLATLAETGEVLAATTPEVISAMRARSR
jgi:nicotinamidase-related amidase